MTSANSARLSMQKTMFARPVKINGTVNNPVRLGSVNAPRFKVNPQEGGESFDHDATLRLDKAEWPEFTSPHHFKKAKVELLIGAALVNGTWTGGTWTAFAVDTTTHVDQGKEWKLGLQARI